MPGPDPKRLRELLDEVAAGRMAPAAAAAQLDTPEDDFSTVDTGRALRTGVAEVVYGAGKSAEQIASIVTRLREAGQNALVTRLDTPKAENILEVHPDAVWHPIPGVLVARMHPWKDLGKGEVLVVCAGTSDLPVAEEAAVVAHELGNRVLRLTDVGVAGIHRVLRRQTELRSARVVIVVAGMEGALASVVAGLTDKPVIAVPTSVGYGAAFGGLAALLGMLNSCAPGVSVVNIDNGFGAAYQAALINRLD